MKKYEIKIGETFRLKPELKNRQSLKQIDYGDELIDWILKQESFVRDSPREDCYGWDHLFWVYCGFGESKKTWFPPEWIEIKKIRNHLLTSMFSN